MLSFSLVTLVALLSTVQSAPAAQDDLAIQAGYHVLYSYPGTTPPSHLYDLTKAGKVGGLILFGENIDDNTATVVKKFQDAYKQSPAYIGYPLLITTDQEGGKVRRVPGGPQLSAKAIGLSSNPSAAATTAGKQAVSALKPYGINGNLAPVVDVFRKPGDFEDAFERSYSNDTNIVSVCGASFVQSQQSGGVLTAAKHFPGLGPAATNENTDARPVTINKSLSELRYIDEFPYKKAISIGVAMVMTSWAVYPSLDSKPSGLSKAWIQDELRGRLGFKGVTISDAIEAGALQAYGTHENRAVLASAAGLDIILAAARNATQGESITNTLAQSVRSGALDKTKFNAATQRIIQMRKTLKF